jgi:hypothetical protein
MFCAPGLVLGGTEGTGSSCHVLRSQNRLGWYGGRRVYFSCFAQPDSFSTVPRTSGPIYMFCAPGLILGGSEGAGSRFHILRSRTRFQRDRGRRVPFHGLRSWSQFRRNRWRPFPFSCFALSDSFSTVTRSSGPVFIFCAPGLIFDVAEGVGSRFHILCSRICFGRYRRRRVQFSCFALPGSFGAVTRVSGPIFRFGAVELILGGTEFVGSGFHVLRSRSSSGWYQGSLVQF